MCIEEMNLFSHVSALALYGTLYRGHKLLDIQLRNKFLNLSMNFELIQNADMAMINEQAFWKRLC